MKSVYGLKIPEKTYQFQPRYSKSPSASGCWTDDCIFPLAILQVSCLNTLVTTLYQILQK